MNSSSEINPHISEARLRIPEAWPPIETDIGKVAEYEAKLEETLKLLGWPESDVLDASMVFREWLLNAMIHGNMGLFQNKGEDTKEWEERIKTAQNLPEVKAKRLYVNINATGNRLTVEIQDEGKDSREFWLENKQPDALQEPTKWHSGRGGILAQAFTNEMSFEKNNKGIKVIFVRDLTKRLR